MPSKQSRNIGKEILEGVRQLKRGEAGRVVTFPPLSDDSLVEDAERVFLALDKEESKRRRNPARFAILERRGSP